MWNDISLATETDSYLSTDTSVIIYTTRKFKAGQRELFGNFFDDSSKIFVVRAVLKSGKWKLFIKKSLSHAIEHSNNKDNWLCYVEGMGKTFPIALSRAYNMHKQYNVQVIMFDYPSINPDYSALRNFNFSKKNATKATSGYMTFLLEIQKIKRASLANKNWVLLHHSMGNIMLTEMLKSQVSLDSHLFNNLIINVPCVKQRKHATWIERIYFCDYIYVNYNKDDFQLLRAYLLTRRYQLGQKIKKPYACNAHYVDFNTLTGKRHSNFINIDHRPPIAPEAFNYYNTLFHGNQINFSNAANFKKCINAPGYIILPWDKAQ